MKTHLLSVLTLVLLTIGIPVKSQDCDSLSTFSGVVPYIIEGNPTACTFGSKPGLKIDGYFEGTFSILSDSVSVFYNCSDDNNYSFEDEWISVQKTGYHEHQSFSFSTSPGLKIEKVIVKGGSANNLKSAELNSIANIYDYSGMAISSDTGLHAATKADCKYYDISHIDFVITQSVNVSHTATFSCQTEKTWMISETALQDTIFTVPGSIFNTKFATELTQTGIINTSCTIQGEITIHNTIQQAFTIDSIIPQIAHSKLISVAYNTGTPSILKPDETIVCTYTAELYDTIPALAGFNVYGNAPVAYEQTLTEVVSAGTSGIINDTVSVYRNGEFVGKASESQTWNHTDTKAYSQENPFTYIASEAIIAETGSSDSDSVLVMVQVPDIDVLTNTIFERTHHWSIEKSASEDTLNLIAGQTTDVEYTLKLNKDSISLGYQTEGIITITNPLKESTFSGQLKASCGTFDAQITGTDYSGNIMLNPGQVKTFPFTLSMVQKPEKALLSVSLVSGSITYGKEIALELPQDMLMTNEVNNIVNVNDSYNDLYWTDFATDSTWSYARKISGDLSTTEISDGFKSFILENTATIVETNQHDNADVVVNYFYPIVDQNTTTSFDRDSEWDLTVTSDPEVHQFPSDKSDITYTIKADKTYTDSEFTVHGSVKITNPSPDMPMTFTVSDMFNGESIDFNEIEPGDSITLEPGELIELTYDYSSDLKPEVQQNNVVININEQPYSDLLETSLNEETAKINESNSAVTVSDTLGLITPEPITESTVLTVARSFDTPLLYDNNYIDGKQSESFSNTFTLSGNDSTNDVNTVVNTTVSYYIPTLVKTVKTEKIREYDWTITKTASVDSLHLLAGEDTVIDYSVKVEKMSSRVLYAIKGVVSVCNTNPDASLFITLMEQVNGAQVLLEGANLYGYAIIEPGTTKAFTYTIKSAEKPADGMAITFMANAYTDQLKTVNFSFDGIEKVSAIENDAVTVTDTYGNQVWENVDTSATFTYPRPIDCSFVNQYDFVDGIYTFNLPNTAKIVELNKTAIHNVVVTCYAPLVTQTVSGEFDRICDWTLEKTSDTAVYRAKEGDVIDLPFTVKAYASFTDSNYKINGEVQITNPHPFRSMQISLRNEFDWKPISTENSDLIIEPGSSATVAFAANVENVLNGYNNSIATLYGLDFADTKHVVFNTPDAVLNGEVTLLDNMLDQPLGTVSYTEQLPAYYSYTISMGPDFTDSLLTINNVVTATGVNDTIVTTANCRVVIYVEPKDSTVDDPGTEPEPVEAGQGCTLTPGYWKTHAAGSNKYDAKWSNLPDLDNDGIKEYEQETFYHSNMTYLEIISGESHGNAYIILGRAFGAAYLNVLAGADPADIAEAMPAAITLLNNYTIEDHDQARSLMIQTATILDRFNNGIIGPGHCNDTDRKSTTTADSGNDSSAGIVSTYPNPSESVVYFNLTIEESSQVKVEVYDAMGNLISVLFDEEVLTTDIKNIELPFYKDPSVLYFYRITVDGRVHTGSLLPQ